MKRLLLTLSILFTPWTFNCVLAQLLFNENFTNSSEVFHQNNWKGLLVEGSQDNNWRLDNPYQVAPFNSLSSDPFITFAGYSFPNDDKAEKAELISPVIELVEPVTQLTLRYYEYNYIDPTGGIISIKMSLDKGKTWQTVLYRDTPYESENISVLREVDLTSFITNSEPYQLQLKFVAQGNNSVIWLMDDIQIIAGPTDPPVIVHEPLMNTCNSSQIPVEAQVTSDEPIKEVIVSYQVNNGDMKRMPLAPVGNNRFAGNFSPLPQNGKINYYISATDASVNSNQSVDTGDSTLLHSFYFGAESAQLMALDFETNDGLAHYIQDSTAWKWELFLDNNRSEERTALMLDFYNQKEAGEYAFIEFSSVLFDNENAMLFDMAYAPYREYTDTLQVFLSVDGKQWVLVYEAFGDELYSAVPSDLPFFPEKDQWETTLIDLTGFEGECFSFAFKGTSNNGNNLFIDNIRFGETAASEQNIYLAQNYPNPVSTSTIIEYRVPGHKEGRLELFNFQGMKILSFDIEPHHIVQEKTLDVSQLSPGIYYYRLTSDYQVIGKRMIIIRD